MERVDIVDSLTDDERREMLRRMIDDVGKLTAALKKRFPLAMGKGDSAVETAIFLLQVASDRGLL